MHLLFVEGHLIYVEYGPRRVQYYTTRSVPRTARSVPRSPRVMVTLASIPIRTAHQYLSLPPLPKPPTQQHFFQTAGPKSKSFMSIMGGGRSEDPRRRPFEERGPRQDTLPHTTFLKYSSPHDVLIQPQSSTLTRFCLLLLLRTNGSSSGGLDLRYDSELHDLARGRSCSHVNEEAAADEQQELREAPGTPLLLLLSVLKRPRLFSPPPTDNIDEVVVHGRCL